jgi:broad specificity phosphatase PhoE
MKLLLIRHAESVGNAERRLQGQGDFPLSDRGLEQARRLAAYLASSECLSALYASPLLRTRQTAEMISRAVDIPIQFVDDLREYDFGEASGLTWTEIGERYPNLLAAVRSRTSEYPSYPGEEGRSVFWKRVCGAVRELCDCYNTDATVAVVTHAGPIVVSCLEVLGLPYQRPAAFAVDNCSITTIDIRSPETRGEDAVLVSVNETCHLAD